MKKVLMLMFLVVLFCCSFVNAATWKTANQVTFSWTEVTTLVNGDAIPQGNSVEYQVYIANAVTDPTKSNPSKISNAVSGLQKSVTLNIEGRFFIGVSAIRIIPGAAEDGSDLRTESVISWSDDPERASPDIGPFGIQYYIALGMPGGLKLQ